MYQIMVVEDEKTIRESIIQLINWSKMSCEIIAEAEHGLQALEMLEFLHPDIIITDIKMPGMDGIQLAEAITKSKPEQNIKIIFLTSYSDFTYAQKAIKFGAIDYVIKMNVFTDLPVAVNKAIEKIEDEKSVTRDLVSLKSTSQKREKAAQDKFFLDILNGVLTHSNEIDMAAMELNIKPSAYRLVLVQFKEDSVFQENNQVLEKRNLAALANMISMAFGHIKIGELRLQKYQFCILANAIETQNFQESSEHSLTELFKICESLIELTDSLSEFSVQIGISSVKEDLGGLRNSLEEARQSIRSNYAYDQRIGCFIDKPPQNQDETKIEIAETVATLLEAIQHGHVEKAKEVLEEILVIFRNGLLPLDQLLILATTIVISSMNFLPSSSTLKNSEPEFIPNAIFEAKSLNDIINILNNLIDQTALVINNTQRNNEIVDAVKRYIENNYTKTITLSAMAKNIHISKNYLCSLYKSVAGENIFDSINKLRIEKAKALLMRSDKKIHEIADEVGINDQSYFSALFKKYVGFSPKDFRHMAKEK